MMTTRLFHSSSAQLLAKTSRKELLKSGPKKPANVYSLFVKDTFQSVKQEHPAASFGELSKLTNLKWKTLTEMQKKPYYDKAARLLKEYHSARAEFEKTLPAKKPASAYILYSNDVRPTVAAQHPSMKPTEIVKLISQKWRNLTETEKSKYNAIYQRHMDQWKAVNHAK